MDVAISVNGVSVRLTHERWYHIVENHDEMASRFHDLLETIEQPDFVAHGHGGALKAAQNLEGRKWIVVVYRETTPDDGFVVTAYLSNRRPKGKVVWQRQ